MYLNLNILSAKQSNKLPDICSLMQEHTFLNMFGDDESCFASIVNRIY